MTGYSKLVKALRCENTGDDECGSSDCPYWSGLGCMDGQLMEDAADAIEALQYEIRESMQKCAECGDRCVEVVRCKDCIHFVQNGWCDREFDWFPVDDMDFCSSAEKMEVQE